MSPAPGNNLVYDGEGMFVPTGAATVNTGCGLTGDGSASAPVRANAGIWPYACDVAAVGGVITCDPATGQLYGEPRGQTTYQSFVFTRDYANPAVPVGSTGVTLDTFDATFTNPDTCRNALVIICREVEVYFTLPGTGSTGPSSAGYGIATDETGRFYNNGSTAMPNVHSQSSKCFGWGTLAPGAAGTYSLAVTGSAGTGGATYHRIEASIRVEIISL